MDDWELLDLAGDPTPGSPDVVRAAADRLSAQKVVLDDCVTRLRALDARREQLQLAGDFAAPFEQGLATLVHRVSPISLAYQAASDALAIFATELEQAQRLSRTALVDGVAADFDYRRLLQAFYSLVPVVVPAGGTWRGLTESTAIEFSAGLDPMTQQEAASIGYQASQCEVDRQAARAQAIRAAEFYEAAANRCARALENAATQSGSDETMAADAGRLGGDSAVGVANAAQQIGAAVADLANVAAMAGEEGQAATWRTGQVDYEDSHGGARLVRAARVQDRSTKSNYGSIRWRDSNGREHAYVATSSAGQHTEQALIAWLRSEAARTLGVPESAVDLGALSDVELYSQREPCDTKPYKCQILLQNVLPNAKVSWSFPWNPPSVRPDSNVQRDAALAELKNLFS
jgi:hypothetical protein